MPVTLRNLSHAAVAAFCLTAWAAAAQAEATPDKAGGAPVASLEERARAFWAARVAGDPVTTYEYEDLKVKGTMTLQSYVGRGGLIYRRADVLGVNDCPAGQELCWVRLDVDFVIPQLNPKKVENKKFEDPWVLVQGQWYHAFKHQPPQGSAQAAPPAPAAPQ